VLAQPSRCAAARGARWWITRRLSSGTRHRR
jgi:hypothetical protein